VVADDEALDVVPGFDDDDAGSLHRAGSKGSLRQHSGGRFGRASLDVVADHVLSLLGFGHHSSPSNEMQQQQQQDDGAGAAPSNQRGKSLELSAMHKERQRQRRLSLGQQQQQHQQAGGSFHEELHGFDGRRVARFSVDGGSSGSAAWSTIPFTGGHVALH
jgi:hypothetical protein